MNRFVRRPPAAALLVAAAIGLLVIAVGAGASPTPGSNGAEVAGAKKAFFDSRQTPAARNVLHGRAAALADNPSAASASLKRSLGVEGFVTLDPLTGTVRSAGSTDGFLTGPAGGDASTIALDFVTKSAAAFGLSRQGIQGLSLARDYVSVDGTHHLYYVQKINGVPVFGNGLVVNVAKDGSVINVVGSPLAGDAAQTSTPGISAGAAIGKARADVNLNGGAAASDSASQVYFRTVDGTRLAYKTQIGTGAETYQSVVDAESGRVLYRRSLVNSANGLVLDYYPGAANGGTVHSVDLTQNGWLSPSAGTLSGPNVHVYSDLDDNNKADAGEETAPGSYPLSTTTGLKACAKGFVCTWDPDKANSWQADANQSAVQLFYFVNKFHDHLAAAPIGFNAAAGNFEGNDPVLGENLDGANSANGLPDGNHIDNANFATLPDGQSGRMQMFLWHQPGTKFPGEDPFIAAMGADEADIVYHENTHGLSNRLVVDSQGNSTLGNFQAGSMGEAWSDWYAMDFLVKDGLQPDTSADGDLQIGTYVGWGHDLIRTQPLDCPVGSASARCPGGSTGHTGGYTYGDFGKIIGQVEVHADGEIWGETLWDLRNALGSATSEALITRAMELSPSNPSMLDERNAILQADLVGFGGSHHDTIWSVFAHRGMGYFAGSVDGDDTRPVADFWPPPAPGTPTGTLQGKVTDVDNGKALTGAVVGFGGHASGFPGDFAGVTKAGGVYQVKNVVFGSYPAVSAAAPGYDRVVVPGKLTIASAVTTRDFQLKRDWAQLGGGGKVADFTGPDYTGNGCGPSSAIDGTLGNGWGSVTNSKGVDDGTTSPENVVIELPVAVNVSDIQIDPANTCGDPGSSSTRGFKVETSTDGTTFSQVATGVFYSGNRHKLNSVSPAGSLTGVRFIRLTILNPQVPNAVSGSCDGPASCGTDPNDGSGVAAHCGPGKDNGFGGCTFMDLSEIEVYGRPS